MKRVRVIAFIITVVLGLAIITGIIIQIFSPRSVIDSTYEIIAFLISGTSVTIALLSQIASYRERKESAKIIRELNEIIADTEADKSLDKAEYKKLNELMTLEQRIYNRLTKKVKRKTKP